MVNPEGTCVLRDETQGGQQDEPPSDSSEEQIPLVAFKDPGKKDQSEDADPEAPDTAAGEEDSTTTAKKLKADFQGLTKEQLQQFATDPFWKRLRLIFFILFWVVWVAMLAAVIIIIVVSPKCPPRPARQFWQRPFYRLQVKSFAPDSDTQASAAGSIEGLAKKMSYLREQLGFNNFIIDSLVATNTPTGCPVNFKSQNSSLGSLESLKALTKLGRKKGFAFLMEFDASQADIDWNGGSSGFYQGVAGESPVLASRNGGAAWRGGMLHLPRYGCPSLNVTSPDVRAKLEEALAHWLDAGLSGFVLTNVAFMAPTLGGDAPTSPPSGSTSERWFDADPTEATLFSNASVDFVRSVRRFLNSQAETRGRELALFVDPGNTGYRQPEARLAAYLHPSDGAHAVVSTGLGVPIDSAALKQSKLPIQLIRDTLAAAGDSGSVAFATAWPSLRRPSESFWAALSLTLPGVPCLYYGQELGMAHVPGVRLSRNQLTSYLTGNSSTDPSETPMQWSGSATNAGWLANDTTPLAWVDLSPRADDIERHNLRRLSSAGHPASELQLVQSLVKLVGSTESLQWGRLDFLATPSERLVVFKRQAERFQPVVVVINGAGKAATLNLREAGTATGTLKVMHSSTAEAASSYEVDKDYAFDRVFSPAGSILIFVGKAEE